VTSRGSKPETFLGTPVLEIDAPRMIERICARITSLCAQRHHSGVVVPLSGGLDSSTVLLLTTRAVGPQRVTALLMPEKLDEWHSRHFAEQAARSAGVTIVIREIGPALEAIGAPESTAGLRTPASLDPRLRDFYRDANRRQFLSYLRGEATPEQYAAAAAIHARHRIRCVTALLVAEERNALLAGCAHLSEDMLGLFVQWGVDDIAHLMPLKHLYRTQILQLAAALGVPDEIIQRPPNPEIVPGIEDKYLDMLGLESSVLDRMIVGIGRGMDDESIASQLGCSTSDVEDIREIIRLTAPMREPPPGVD
jgi:NAD+ synthase